MHAGAKSSAGWLFPEAQALFSPVEGDKILIESKQKQWCNIYNTVNKVSSCFIMLLNSVISLIKRNTQTNISYF